MLVAITAIVFLTFFVPYFAERVQYAITRGKQRAESEAAAVGLESAQLESISRQFQLVSKRVAPTVVNINVLSIVDVEPQDDLSALFGPRRRQAQGQGSGVIVDRDGYIITNFHVVRGATRIEVSLADGRILPAELVGDDPLTDLALLKVTTSNLEAAEWGDSSSVEVGSLVWAVGSPFGLQHSVTAGIISGKNRPGLSGSVYYDFLQTDAAVNPGNSGGPLVDTRGRIIGINTAIVGEAFQGISFAIPSNEARDVYERLRGGGRVERGWLGVSLGNIDADVARQLGFEGDTGVLVTSVSAGSPAEATGMRPGDIIVKWDGQPAEDSTQFSRLVARTKVGSTVEILVWRRGQELKLPVTVGQRPPGLRG
jgi:S1-C subfamily serine protease